MADWRTPPTVELDAIVDKQRMGFFPRDKRVRPLEDRVCRGWIDGKDGRPILSLADLPRRALPKSFGDGDRPCIPRARGGPPTLP